MEDFHKTLRESIEYPDQVFKCTSMFYDNPSKIEFTGSVKNGMYDGEFKWFRITGEIHSNRFYKCSQVHGESILYNAVGVILKHCFMLNNRRVEELDYLVNDPRDEAFYVTLALYGIDKEYTIGAK